MPDAEIGTAPILGTVLGEQNTYGALSGRTPAGPLIFARISTDDSAGRVRAYVSEGRFIDDSLETSELAQWPKYRTWKKLLRYICKQGFEHYAAMAALPLGRRFGRSDGNMSGLGGLTGTSELETRAVVRRISVFRLNVA